MCLNQLTTRKLIPRKCETLYVLPVVISCDELVIAGKAYVVKIQINIVPIAV